MYNNDSFEKVKFHPDIAEYFKELPSYNKHIKKPKIKKQWFAFWTSFLRRTERNKSKLCVWKIRNELQSWNNWKKDPIKQLEGSKSSIKDLFSDLLNETKGFKYQITLKVTLKKYKPNGEIEFRPVYFNSATKTVINHKFSLENAFQEILYKVDNWINEAGLLN